MKFQLCFQLITRFLLFVLLGANSVHPQQLPSGANFQAGIGKINYHNSSVYIRQSSSRAVIDWQSFNVGQGGAVHFIQPNQAAATLNRVTGGGVSQILGQIKAPGQVFITNSNGVLFGKTASVDVGSLVASSFDIGTDDFMSGNLKFKSNNALVEGVVNSGELKAKEKGFIALLAPEVRNEGVIFAKKGSVVLASGEMIELQTDPAQQLIGVRVTPGKWDALVENKKVIEAENGMVVLSAQAERSIFKGLVKNSGVIQAHGIQESGGRIILTAGVGGGVLVDGELDASSEFDQGGLVTIEGDKIELVENSLIDVTGNSGGGDVLVGGDWQGGVKEELRVMESSNAIQQASEVIMKEDAVIDASAITVGDGGTVVLWSDIFNTNSATSVLGEIYSQGGSTAGDGGNVETSGHYLDINHAKISTFAPYGKTGDWLLDPGHIEITTAGTNGSHDLPNSITSPTTKIHPDSISNALSSNNVTLATGGSNYDLTVTNGLSSSSGRNLTLNASRDIIVNAELNLGSGQLTLNAGDDLTISGNITAGQLDLDAGGGDITVNNSLDTSAADGNANLDADGTVSIAAAINSGTGALSISAGAALTIGASITSGSIDFDATNNFTLNNSYTINTSASNGALDVDSNDNLTINGTINTGTGTVTLDGQDGIAVGSSATINSGSQILTTLGGLSTNGSLNAGSGTILLEANDNVTVGANLTTTNETANAIKVIAGKNESAGTETGGDVIISGSPSITVGTTSGRATFFSGDIANSTGLTGLVGSGSNNFRYNSDETTNFSAGNWLDLGNGKFAVYREQPTLSLDNISREYGENLNLAAITISSGGVNGDTLDSSTLAVDNTLDPEPQPVTYTSHSGGAMYLDARTSYTDGTWTPDPYYLNSNLRKMGYSVGGGLLSVTRKTVTLVAEKTYDGNNVLVNDGTNPNELTIGNLFPGESLTFTNATTSNYHVASVDSHRYVNNITLGDAAAGAVGKEKNYKTPHLGSRSAGNNQVTINKKPLIISLNSSTNTTKNYDKTPDASVTFSPQYDFVGLVEGDDGADVSYESAIYSSANAGTGKTLTISGLVVNFLTETADGSDQSPKSYPTDYEITIGGVPSTTLVVSGVEIAKAPLTVRANDSFKFDGTSDPVGYNGVSYEGFAPGESSSDLSSSTPIFNRSATPQAGGAGNTYDLSPSGLAAANYSFNYQNGTFTIVPQNQLVVSVANENSIYGDSVTYTLNSVSYFDSSSVTQTVSVGTGAHTYSKSSNEVTVRDNSNDSIVFTVSPSSPVNSTAGQLVVGSYTLEATSVTNNNSDFDNTVQVIGAHAVSPRTLVPTVSGGKVKIYDGDPDMKGLTISVPSIASDVVTVSGVGTYRSILRDESNNPILDDAGNQIWFRDKNVEHDGTPRVESHTTMYDVVDKKYRVENIALEGADSSNYVLSTNVLEGLDGRINQRPILYLPSEKTYDGTDFLKTKYHRESHNDYRYSGGVLVDNIKILNPADDTTEKLGLINNERFFYSYGPHEGSGGSIETRVTDSGKINNQHVIGPDLNKVTNKFPHETGYNAGTATDSHITKVVMQSDPAGSGFLPQNYILPGENHPSLSSGFDTSNAPVRVNPKDITIDASKIYDSTVNLASLTLTTGVTNESLQYSNVTTAAEHAGSLNEATGIRSQTYVNQITLSDAADARYTDNASGHNPTGYISDYTFSGQDLWNASDKTTKTVNPVNSSRNNVTINPKAITISGITVNDQVYSGSRSASSIDTSTIDWNAVGRIAVGGVDDDLSIASISGLFNTKNVNGNELDKTVTFRNSAGVITITYGGTDVDNYTITDQETATAKILKRPVGIYRSREYNANTAIGHPGTTSNNGGLVHTGDASVSGLVGSETIGFTVTLADNDVDGPDNDVNTRDNYITGISSWINGSNGGLANNYKFYDDTYAFNSNYNSIAITPREVDLQVTKTYDGTTDLTGDVSIITGVTGESLNYTGATSSSKDVSNTRYVNAITLQNGPSGEKASNYSRPSLGAYHSSNNKVDINKKNLIVTGLSSANKVYDGDRVASVGGTAALNAAISTAHGADNDGTPLNVDSVNLIRTTAAEGVIGRFNTENVGTRTVTFSNFGLTGSGAGNYNVVNPSESRDITSNVVQLSAIKLYDGTNIVDTDDTVSIVTSAGETLGFSGARTADVNVNYANNYFTHFTLENGTGPNAGLASNYDVPSFTHHPTNNSVTINQRNLRIKADNETKTYGTAATLNGATAFSTVGPDDTYGLQNGETVGSVTLTASGGGELASANAGTYTITPSAPTGGTFNINNYNVIYATGTLTKNKKWLGITGLSALNKVYDATNDASISSYGTLTGILFSDAVSLDIASLNADPNSANFGNKNAGSGKTVTLTLNNGDLIGAAATNYRINNKTTTANITEKPITISGISASNKIYNRALNATVDATGASGWIAGDTVTVNTTGQFADKNVGTGKTVNLTSTYGGADRNNYIITDQATTTANITGKPITISGITASNKIYDRALNATVDTTGASGWISGDTVTVNTTGQFADKNVGTGKTVNLTSTYGGADRNNYIITDQATTTANITEKPITISGITAGNKIYDRGTVATVDLSGANGWIAGDDVTLNGTVGQFADKNVGTGKTVILSGSTYGGADRSNYAITDQTGTIADISPKSVTISGITASDKIYDSIRTADIDTTGASGWIVGDDLIVSASGQFADKNVGTAKTITLSSTYGGADRSNYTITDQTSTTADITRKSIMISGITASDKIYDSTRTADIDTSGATGWISGDAVTVSATGLFSDKNVGTGKTVNLTSTYGGADRNNYIITDQTVSFANVSPKLLNVLGLSSIDKVYDGTLTATTIGTPSLLNSVSVVAGTDTDRSPYLGDSLSINTDLLVATFNSSNVLLASNISFSGLALSGIDAGNYTLQNHSTTNNSILPKTVGLSAGRVYDGTKILTGADLSITTGVGTESLSYSGATVNSKDVAAVGKYIDAITLEDALDGSGGLASNYQLPSLNEINAPVVISPKTVSLSASKIYDSGHDLTGYVSIATGVGTESLSYSGATVNSKDVAVAGKYIDAITLEDALDGSGGLASNYQLPTLDASNAPVTISAKEVGLSASRIYDGSELLSGSDVTITTGVGAETLSYSGATVNSKDVAVVGKYIDAITLEDALDGSGGLASNYQLPSLDSLNAPVLIMPKTVSLSASKIYDAGVDLTGYVSLSTGIGIETLSYSGASSSSKDVAVAGKYIDAITLEDASDGTGGLASNYLLPPLDAQTAPVLIEAKTVGLSASRIYDGSEILSGSDVSITTGIIGETLNYSGATANSKDVGVAENYIDTIILEDAVDGSGGLASNYQLPSLDSLNSLVSITPKVVELSAKKIYDTLLTLAGSDVVINTGVGGETLSYEQASVSSKDVTASGKYISGITLKDSIDGSGGLASNFSLPTLDALNAPVVIEPASLIIQAPNEVKTYGRDAVLDENIFEVSGLQGQEQITNISLQSDGGDPSAEIGLYEIVPSNAMGVSFDPENYDIDYLNGVLIVEASPFEQKTALVTVETLQNKVSSTKTSSVETVDTSTFSTITPTSIGPPPPTFITAPPSSLAVPTSVLPTASVTVPTTSVTPTPIVTPTAPISTPVPTATPTPTPTPTPTAPISTPVPTAEPTVTPTPSTPETTPVPTAEPTVTPTSSTPEATPTPAAEPTATSSSSAPEPTPAAPASESTATPSSPAGNMASPTQNDPSASGSSPGLTVDLLDRPDTSTVGLVAVSVPKETTTAGTGFSFEVPKEISTMTQKQEVSVEVTLETGAPLPNWLNYQKDTGKFSSTSVPDGAFPITVIMKIGTQQVAVVISERGE